MSIVLAVEKAGRVALAWDTMTSIGPARCVNQVGPAKVLRAGDTYLGVAGYTVYLNALDHYLARMDPPDFRNERSVFGFFVQFWKDLRSEYHFVNDEADDDHPSPFADLGTEFLVVNPSGIFRVKEILSVSRYARFCAIGSGAPHAEGALHVLYEGQGSALEIAKRAAEAVLEFDAACGGTIETVDMLAADSTERRSTQRRSGARPGQGRSRRRK